MINDYDTQIQGATQNHLPEGYDWRLYKAQLWQESRLKPNAKSPAGASGIAQIMPRTWAEWSVKAGFAGVSPMDPVASINTGAMYMNNMIQSWYFPRPEMDRICLALASYNAGKGNIIKAQINAGNPSLYRDIIQGLESVTKHHSVETIEYVKKILNYWTVQITG